MNNQEITDLAKTVVTKHQNWWSNGDRKDLEEAAWFGIAELLTQDPEATTRQLWDAGVKAVIKDIYQYKKIHYGGVERSDLGATIKYWTATNPFADPESAVEGLAVQQVLAAIEPSHRRVLQTLADNNNDMDTTADQLGTTKNNLYARLSEARKAFLILWYDRETPGKLWHKKTYLRYVK